MIKVSKFNKNLKSIRHQVSSSLNQTARQGKTKYQVSRRNHLNISCQWSLEIYTSTTINVSKTSTIRVDANIFLHQLLHSLETVIESSTVRDEGSCKGFFCLGLRRFHDPIFCPWEVANRDIRPEAGCHRYCESSPAIQWFWAQILLEFENKQHFNFLWTISSFEIDFTDC